MAPGAGAYGVGDSVFGALVGPEGTSNWEFSLADEPDDSRVVRLGRDVTLPRLFDEAERDIGSRNRDRLNGGERFDELGGSFKL